MADYDLAIIGGGLNGVSIARDAAGRGLRVILLEQGDLGGGASQASPRLIHGDLAGLERRRFLRVRAALAERDTWLRIAPHLVRPMRFAIPAHADERPAWQLRSWLLLYDRLVSRNGLAPSATVDVTHHPVGNALKRPFGTAFEYSDCIVDDSRLVILCARRCRGPRRRNPYRRALHPGRTGSHMAAGDDRPRPSPGGDRARARQRPPGPGPRPSPRPCCACGRRTLPPCR